MAAVRKPRNRSGVIESDPEDDLKPEPASVKQEISSGLVDMDTDISQLEAPTFTTLADRGPSQAMLNLQWHHTANLIGKKVQKDHFWDFLIQYDSSCWSGSLVKQFSESSMCVVL